MIFIRPSKRNCLDLASSWISSNSKTCLEITLDKKVKIIQKCRRLKFSYKKLGLSESSAYEHMIHNDLDKIQLFLKNELETKFNIKNQ